jgi:hypothetical protein
LFTLHEREPRRRADPALDLGETMMISRSAAGLAAAACLVVLAAGCGANGGAPEAGASRTPAATTTAAPSAPASASATTTAPVTTAPGSPASLPRCHTSQLTAAYTGLNAAMGGTRGMTLILTNHSDGTCYLYGYPGLAFFDGGPMATHLTWMKAPHAKVILHPGGNAQAMLTWRVNVGTATPFNPSFAHITPPDEYTYLTTLWQGGPVLGGDIVSWPLQAAPAGPFPAGTGTISNPFNGMCVALAGDGATVVAWKPARWSATLVARSSAARACLRSSSARPRRTPPTEHDHPSCPSPPRT